MARSELSPRPTSSMSPPDLFTAFREQLGLKLESTKLADVLVIDGIEKPSPNNHVAEWETAPAWSGTV